MKVSDVIVVLNEVLAEHGDIEVVCNTEYEDVFSIAPVDIISVEEINEVKSVRLYD